MFQKNFCSYNKKYIFSLVIIFLISTFIMGCSSGDTYIIQSSPTPTPDFNSQLQEVLSNYFPQSFINQLNQDTQPIIKKYNNINIFTTSQYGKEFIVGTVNIKDVFDARISKNYEIFKKYAKDNLLILNPPETGEYYKYALAATNFVREYEYDVIVFHPDEFHPVLSHQKDTWIFIREDPDGDPHGSAPGGIKYYYSARIDKRHPVIMGGIKMEPLNNNELWKFYIPVAGEKYEKYQNLETEIVSGSKNPELLNKYTPTDATAEILTKRKKLGIIISPLSNKNNLLVGGWKSKSYIKDIWDTGFTFSGAPDRYTWGGGGHYVIAIDNEFWK